MEPNNKKISILAMEVEPVTVTDPKFWKWADQILDSTLNLSGSIIAFMGDSPLEGRLWLFKIPRENPWAWPELNY